MFEAARLHDEIEHTSALAGFLAGAVIGLAIATAATFTLCTAGLGGFCWQQSLALVQVCCRCLARS